MSQPAPTLRGRADALFEALASAQFRRPWLFLLFTFSLAGVGLWLATRLRVITGFEALLPETRASVVELHRVAARTSGVATVFVVLEGEDTAALRKASDALVAPLGAIGRPWVGAVENGVQDVVAFLGPRAGLYAELPALKKLREDVEARVEYESAKANGGIVADDAPPEINASDLQKRFGLKESDRERFPDGYYQSKDGKAVVVAIRAGVVATDIDQATEALRRIREVIAANDPKRFDANIRWGLSGDLVIGLSEYRAINEDLRDVGLAGGVAILAVVLLYYLRLRTLLAMLLTITVGLSWTFGLTYLTMGKLNTATAFLFTIVGGNGINFAILIMARYLEAQRAGEPIESALRTALRETWVPTLTTALAASAAYASLLATEFRGFKDFGGIGGGGMALCWLATVLTLPSVLAVLERLVPSKPAGEGFLAKLGRWTENGIPFGKPFAWVVGRSPAAVVVVGLALTIGSGWLAVRHVRGEPLEYDLNNLQSDMSKRAEEQRLVKLAKEITGYVGLDGMAILVDRPDQVAPLRAALRARRDEAPAELKPFKEVYALQDWIPSGQAEKVPEIVAIAEKARSARKLGAISDADWKKIEGFLPPKDLKPFDVADLPDGLARLYTEADGTRGRIVYISPTADELTNDARYLFRWADSFRRTELADGSVVLGSGRAVIYADMWAAVLADIPKAVALSFGATLLVVLAAFRFGRGAFAVVFALLVGVSWMVGAYALLDLKLNFLNFIALPITFGIGVDYALNITQRYVREGPGSATTAIHHTGGAVILCSMTTLLGYLALVRSVNFAVRSLGIAAVVGEVTCLLAAVAVLPAVLELLDRRRARPAAPRPSSGDGALEPARGG